MANEFSTALKHFRAIDKNRDNVIAKSELPRRSLVGAPLDLLVFTQLYTSDACDASPRVQQARAMADADLAALELAQGARRTLQEQEARQQNTPSNDTNNSSSTSLEILKISIGGGGAGGLALVASQLGTVAAITLCAVVILAMIGAIVLVVMKKDRPEKRSPTGPDTTLAEATLRAAEANHRQAVALLIGEWSTACSTPTPPKPEEA